jgi:hypothetical protein
MSGSNGTAGGPDIEFEVYARRLPTEEMRRVGTVRAPDADLARVYAHTVYDEEAWVEMAVVPRGAVVSLPRRGTHREGGSSDGGSEHGIEHGNEHRSEH